MKPSCHIDFVGNPRGAAMLEFTLVVGLLVGIVLTFFDVAHYFLVRMLMIRAAQQALSVASTDPRLQSEFISSSSLPAVDASTSKIPSDPDGSYSKYLGARSDVIATAAKVQYGSVISPPGSGGLVELTTFRANDEYKGGIQAVDGFAAAVVRPGESWYSNLQGKRYDHPAFCSKAVSKECSTPPPANTSMRQMLQTYPIVVALEARKRSFLLWGSTIPITVSAVGWAQIYPKSPYDIKDFTPASSAVTTPTPTPCPRTPATCAKWNTLSCKCLDEQPCGPGEHWVAQWDDPRCSTCPLAESYLPGQAPAGAPSCAAPYRYIDWRCICDCPEEQACKTGFQPSMGGTCSNCVAKSGSGSVGH